MARAAPNLSVVISMLATMALACGGLVVLLKYHNVQVKDFENKEAGKKKKDLPTGPYADRILKLDTRIHAATQGNQDDRPGLGVYCDTEEPGLYLDVVSDEVLFSSRDKLASTGYAEFARPVDESLLTEEPEIVDGTARIRVKSKKAATRLGWKGPDAENHTRYFLNSTALRFVPAADLDKEGLAAHRKLIEGP